MSKIKSIITLIILVIAAIGLVGPKIIGNNAIQKIDQMITSMNDLPGYQVNVVSVESGWFSTSTKIDFGIDEAIFGEMSMDPELAAFFENFSLTIDAKAQHGPFLTLNGLKLGLLALKAEVDESIFRDLITYSDDRRLVSLYLDVSLFGNARYSDSVEGFTVIGMDGISFSGWAGKGTMSSTHIDYKGQMDSLIMDLGAVAVEINSISLAFDADDSLMKIMTDPFYNSSFESSMGSLTVSPMIDQNRTITIENILMDGISQQSDDGKLMDVDFNYGIGKIIAPQFTAKDLVVKSEFLNLERGFVTAIQEASANPLVLEEMASDFENKVLPQLKASPAFNITDISGTFSDGQFSGNIFTKITGVDGIPVNIEDPVFWASKLVVDAKLKVERAIALFIAERSLFGQFKSNTELFSQMSDSEIQQLAEMQAVTMLDMLSTQGMIASNAEGNFEIDFIMKDGQATLNGNPMPLPF